MAKEKYVVECLCGIGYVYSRQVYAESPEEAMEFLRKIEKEECDYYWDHAGGLIEVTRAWRNYET